MKKIIIALLICLCSIPIMAIDTPDVGKLLGSDTIETQKLNPLSFYKPCYIVFGNAKDQVLAQISFKIALFSVYDSGFFAGYSQMMWWDLYKPSAPFRETNYNPEIFWKWRMQYGILDFVQIVFVEHTSNGLGGPESRSMNGSYGQIGLAYGKPVNIGFNVKVSWTWNTSSQNKDIGDYTGYYDAEIFAKLGKHDGITDKEKISVKWHTGSGNYGFDWKKGFVEVGLQCRLLIKEINPNIFLQGRYGYGEGGLIDYNRKEYAIRLGLTLD